jgi:putative aldouronate transport system substrate-binding protein
VLDKLESDEGSALITDGIEGRNYKRDGKYAVPINQDDPQVKIVQNDVNNAFIQLGTRYSVNGGFYPLKPDDPAKLALIEQRKPMEDEDLKTAVFNPGYPVLPASPTYLAQGPKLDPIIGDARVKYLSGEIDENGLKAEIKRWYDSGGAKIAQEVNDLLK